MQVNGFKNKKVVVMGLGLNGGGVGVAKFFAEQGSKVLVTDLKTKEKLQKSIDELKDLDMDFVLGEHRETDFSLADLVIKNPAVPNTSKYLKLAKEVKTDIQIFFDLCPAKIIGVTGTKGKSTTATLIREFLKTKFKNVFLAGNIGITPLKILPEITKNSLVVLELSSFELEDLRKSPHVAVITNLFEDHLNRYKTVEEYFESKKPIFEYQSEADILFLNEKLENFAEDAKSRIIYFSNEDKYAPAVEVARFYRISEKTISEVLGNFKGVPYRQEFILEKDGVKYIDDTAATTPESVQLAIKEFSNIVLITGGEDKNLDYKNLAKTIKEKLNFIILLPGTASDKLEKALENFKIYRVNSMAEAVKKAKKLAKAGDIVLLSPGAASFNLFNNEFDRGNQFVECVKAL
jgi:UDP-N-acetylmuramoylalanine--D-glutamate ligase